MLAFSGLGNVLGCDVNDLVCLEVACGAGMDVNPDAGMRSVAPCVPRCGPGTQLNPGTLTCGPRAPDFDLIDALTPIGSEGTAMTANQIGPAARPKSSAWKWILGLAAVAGLGLLAYRHHARAA